jgi:ferrous iron transport protein A
LSRVIIFLSANTDEINHVHNPQRRLYLMNERYIPLSLLPLGRKAMVRALTSDGSARRRMLDLGLIAGTQVEALQKSPSGDPTAYSIRGAVIALRSEEAGKIMVEAH